MHTSQLYLSILALAFICCISGSCTKKIENVQTPCYFPDSLNQYSLIWSDEFDFIDTSKWEFMIGNGCEYDICGWGNNELQYYTDSSRNARTIGGKLQIRAYRENNTINGFQYSSARLRSKNKADFTFGRTDVRAKLPKGQGIWPAVWMLPTDNLYGGWPASGEIDIVELVGHEPNTVHATIHYGSDFHRSLGESFSLSNGEDFSDQHHIFTLLWAKDCMKFLIDGEEYSGPYTPTKLLPTGYPFNERFHLLMNLAVGGNWPGNPNSTTSFPQTLEIDYIRVYTPQ